MNAFLPVLTLVVLLLALPAVEWLEAGQPGQAVCAAGQITVQGGDAPEEIPGALVTISGPQNAVVHFSADVAVSAGAEVRLSWSIDGVPQPEFVFGPANLANAAEFAEARALMNVIPVEPGHHTIQALWRVSGPPTATGVMFGRCLAAQPTQHLFQHRDHRPGSHTHRDSYRKRTKE